MMTKEKKPDNIILFPKIPMKRPNQKAQELDAKRQEMMRLQHNKVYVQAISEQLTESMLLILRDENISITDKTCSRILDHHPCDGTNVYRCTVGQ